MTTPATEPDILHRIRHTPVRDLLRLRFTGRLDLNRKLDAANLPLETAALIRTTVTKTRLHRLEKTQVAEELIAHFRDAAHAVPPATDPVADFGDPAAAAKLIRRAKKRQRPFGRTRQAAKLTVAAAVLLYAALAIRVFWGAPEIKIDYLARVNTAARTAPEEQKAWPIYRDAWIAAKFTELDLNPLHRNAAMDMPYARPADPQWRDTLLFLAEHRSLLDALRLGGAMPRLGFEAAFDGDYSPADAQALYGASVPPVDPTTVNAFDRRWVVNALIPHLGPLRKSSRLLDADARVAAATGEPQRSLRDLAALGGLAHQSAELPFLVNGLVGIQILNLQQTAAAAILTQTPDALNDAQLQQLDAILAAPSPADLFRYDGEIASLLDTLQRIYTDDGHGDGRITDEGFRFLNDTFAHAVKQVQGPSPLTLNPALFPAAMLTYAGRAEVRGVVNEFFRLTREDRDIPLWKQPRDRAERYLDQLSPQQMRRLGPVLGLLPATGFARELIARMEATRTALRLAIALERHRLTQGSYPSQLPHLDGALPHDPITGGPLHYTLQNGRPLIYSVGADRDDDGGRLVADNGTSHFRPATVASQWLTPEELPTAPDGDWILYPFATGD